MNLLQKSQRLPMILVVWCLLATDSLSAQRMILLKTIPDAMRYDHEWIHADPGESLRLVFENHCRMQHNWVLCEPGSGVTMKVARAAWVLGDAAVAREYVPEHPAVREATGLVNPGESVRMDFTAPDKPGDYPYVCTLPGHALTMTGVLHVGSEKEAPPATTVAERKGFDKTALERAATPMQRYRPLMDGGPTLAGIYTMHRDARYLGTAKPIEAVHRGMAIRLGARGRHGVLFDKELLKYSIGWSGGFIRLLEGREDERAEYRHRIGGEVHFSLPEGTGWLLRDGGSSDPRPSRMGSLPQKEGRYLGHYRIGERVVLHYEVQSTEVLDSPWMESDGVFLRDLYLGPSNQGLSLRLSEASGIQWSISEASQAILKVEKGIHMLHVNPRETPTIIRVAASLQPPSMVHAMDLKEMIRTGNYAKGGPVLTTKGVLGEGKGPYVVDHLRLPYDNPWNALLYTSGHDFFSNGDAALCTSHGDVWRVSGLDASLQSLQWKRMATGFANPLGLRIVQDQVHVLSLHEISRLHDVDRDGWADYYECFHQGLEVSASHHRFATDLQTDEKGNFYYLKCTEEGRTAHGGSVVRVSPDGASFDLFATGLRNPNGLGMGPNGMMMFGKQQGTWIPSSGIQVVEQGGFYGYVPSHHRVEIPRTFDPPLCWIPHGMDNSSGAQVWSAPDERWGPLSGRWLHLSYGKCQLFQVLMEKTPAGYQGGVVRIPDVEFESGAMRGRFREADGQLYVTGLRGWQTTARMAGCFQRVRYTGHESVFLLSLTILSDGMALTFSAPLDPLVAADPDRYQAQSWNYRWTKAYGSPEFKPSSPQQQGRDPVIIDRVDLSEDHHTVNLRCRPHAEVMQMGLIYDLVAASGMPVRGELHHTIHHVPEP